jgi:hypothetical protein
MAKGGLSRFTLCLVIGLHCLSQISSVRGNSDEETASSSSSEEGGKESGPANKLLIIMLDG